MGAKVSVTTSEVSTTGKHLSEMPYLRSAKDFTKLKSINYSRNRMHSFPKDLGPDLRTYPPIIDTLVELDLSGNELEALPDEICLLVSLKKLRLEGNHLNRLPVNFPALWKLEKLYLNNNDLTELPVDMGNLAHLKVLRIHHNRLFWIPNEIGALPLAELTIHENPLRPEVLELGDLEAVLAFFRNQQAPLPYTKALKAHHTQSKIRDGLHELKEGRLHAFRVMLASEDSKSFQAFLEKEIAHENLHFYRDADNFRARFSSNFPTVSKELRDAGLTLYKKYIEEAPQLHKFAINIPVSVKKKLDEAFAPGSTSPPDQWVFADAYVAITKLMFEDSFKRFLETAEGKRIWAIYESHAHHVRSRQSNKKDKSATGASKASSSTSTPRARRERKKDSESSSAVLSEDDSDVS